MFALTFLTPLQKSFMGQSKETFRQVEQEPVDISAYLLANSAAIAAQQHEDEERRRTGITLTNVRQGSGMGDQSWAPKKTIHLKNK